MFCFKKNKTKKISVLSQRIYFNLYIPLSPFLGIETFKIWQTTQSTVAGATAFRNWAHNFSNWFKGPAWSVSSWWGHPLRQCQVLFRLTDCGCFWREISSQTILLANIPKYGTHSLEKRSHGSAAECFVPVCPVSTFYQ